MLVLCKDQSFSPVSTLVSFLFVGPAVFFSKNFTFGHTELPNKSNPTKKKVCYHRRSLNRWVLFLLILTIKIGFTSTASVTYSSVGTFTFVIPPGVSKIQASLYGASGGTAVSVNGGVTRTGNGGLGGLMEANIPVTAGETLQLNVGGQGGAGGANTAGSNGGGAGCADLSDPSGGGGGASDIRRSPYALSDRLIVAGGGGGGYSFYYSAGGNGGYPSGGNGVIDTAVTGRYPPTGGTATAGGTTTDPSPTHCFSVGTFGVGGSCCNMYGGGGGGGYWGGGLAYDTAGGRGSSYIGNGVQLLNHGNRATPETGSIVIFYFGDPTLAPTLPPTKQPSPQPSGQPSMQPSRQPSNQPSRQPSSQPSCQPSAQPSRQPSTQPSRQPSAQPTKQPVQPSSQPSMQPSRQPSVQPSGQPTNQPSSQPTMQPSIQPSRQPSCNPSTQPSCSPSAQPTEQPSSQPRSGPTARPSSQPNTSPTSQPISMPSSQPSGIPTLLPSAQPSHAPSCQPTFQPSARPSAQPTSQPSTQPSHQPTAVPTIQPSDIPSSDPTVQPVGFPSKQPLGSPSSQPSRQPSAQPAGAPSQSPSSQPSIYPSTQPTGKPSSQPSFQPASVPSGQPTQAPSCHPTEQPTNVPSVLPSAQPSPQPSGQPSTNPSAPPSQQPFAMPSASPTVQPSMQPSCQPSRIPTTQPSTAPSYQPTSQPSTQPTDQPTRKPSNQPSIQPSMQPSGQPSIIPSAQPTLQPSTQPANDPTSQPSSTPTTVPTQLVTTGEYVYYNTGGNNTSWTTVAHINSVIWGCGNRQGENECVLVDSLGRLQEKYPFEWSSITSVLQTNEHGVVIVSGQTYSTNSMSATIGKCVTSTILLECAVKTFPDTNFLTGSFSPSVDKLVYIGTNSAHASISVLTSTATVQGSYRYTASTMKGLSLTHVQSPPNFVGSFVVGTCTSFGSMTYILAGMVRTDSGYVTAMYLTPASAIITNNAELVSAMALEYAQPDTFIGGGLQTVGDTSVNAYVLCVNALYQKFIYGTRYQVHVPIDRGRRTLHEVATEGNCVVKGLVIIESVLYVLVSWNSTVANSVGSRISILKTNMASGDILQQVHIFSNTSSVHCTQLNSVGLFLNIACLHTSAQGVLPILLSVDRQLTFSQLPYGFERETNTIFSAESMTFLRTKLPVTLEKASLTFTDSTFSAADGKLTSSPTTKATALPIVRPTAVPSTQPRSSPTSGPSVSPQPTSHPSSGSPTITFKPTVEPTVKPTASPTNFPTQHPALQPSTAPTARPTMQPSRHPSTQPSMLPTRVPSRTPQNIPAFKPTASPSNKPTRSPSSVSTVADTYILIGTGSGSISGNSEESNLVLVIGGSILGGLVFLWCGRKLLVWYVYARIAREKQKAVLVSVEHTRIPLSNLPGPVVMPIQKDQNVLVRGAYATGRPIVTYVEKQLAASGSVSRPLSIDIESRNNNPSNPDIGGEVEDDGVRASSSSLSLSSLHSSEMSSDEEQEEGEESNSEHSHEHGSIPSEEEFSEYSHEQYYMGSGASSMSDVTQQSHAHSHSHSQSQSQSDPTRSRESAMEEGSGNYDSDVTGSREEYS